MPLKHGANLIDSTVLIEEDSPTETSPLNKIINWCRKLPALALLIACAITLPSSSMIVLNPDHHDGAIFIYVGDMWARGIVPYVQLFDNKPPGIFALTAIATSTHHTLWALALIEFLFVMGCVFAVRKTLQIVRAPEGTVFFGTIATALIVNLPDYGAGNMTEAYMVGPMAASMLAFVCAVQTGKLRYVFLAGVCSGLACIFKPFSLSVFMAQVAFTLFNQAPGLRAVTRSILANIAGAVTAWIPVSIYFALHGGLKQMLDASFFYNLHYGIASQHKTLDLLSMLAATLLPLSTMVGCIVIGLVTLRKHMSQNSSVRSALWVLTLLWFGFGLALVLVAGRGYKHYFMSLTPALGLAAALVFWSIEEREATRGVRLAICALMLSPIAMTHVLGLVEAIHTYQDVALHRHKVTQIDVTAMQLQQIAEPSSTVFVWGFEPWVFSSTHLRNALRFPTSQYIYDSPRSYAEVGREILSGMQTTPPNFVVVTPSEMSINWPLESDPVKDEFMGMLQKSYTKVWEKDSYLLYKHN
jgi:hypothetical protein